VNFIYADTFRYIITNQISSNGYWETTDWNDGTYCLRIRAYDIVSFYKKFVLIDTTKLNVTPYDLHDVQLKNGLHGNHNPVIDTSLHCMNPQGECASCFHHGDERTIEISAYDPDGDPLHYVWWCNYGYFIVGENPVAICTTQENYVVYQAPISFWNQDHLFVDVCDNRGGSAQDDGWVDVFSESYSCICGDINYSGQVELGDPVMLIGYLYKGGPPPYDPIERADVNNNCAVEIGDIVYLISYSYKNGPRVECCWIH